MKEKTFKDLGLDEGDKYLKKLSLDYDLGEFGELDNILQKNENEENEAEKKKIEQIKNEI